MTIKNYTIEQFLLQDENLINKYMAVLSFLKPKNSFVAKSYNFRGNYENKTFRCKSLWDLPFFKIENIKEMTSNLKVDNIINLIKEVYDIETWQIMTMRIIDFYAVLSFIKKEAENILIAEKTNFKSNTDPKLIIAGIEKLNKFGVLNSIDSLAKGDVLKWKEIEKMPYRIIHYKLWKDIETNTINENYYKQ